MSQRVRVQDGIISYSASDPDYDVNFTIDGRLNVANQVNIDAGLITTPNNVNLLLNPGLNGNITATAPVILNADPVTALAAATKQYVDNIAAGLNAHAACVTATTATLASSTGGTITYNNGVSGVGATLTTTTTWGTIGGQAVVIGNRVLVKNQTNQIQNGIYVITSSTAMTRATDFDDSPDGEVDAGDFTYIQLGTLNNTQWVQITVNPVIGSSNIVFTQLSGQGTYTGGTGINVTGTTISNTGVVNASAGTNINVSPSTGNITIGLPTTLTGLTSVTSTTFVGALTGNASTATILQTARNINGTSFNGSANITITAAAGTLTGTTLNSTVTSSSLTSVGTLSSLTVTGNTTISTGNLRRSVLTGISAAGTTLATATNLTRDINVVSTVAASTGVNLPAVVAGLSITVINTGANTLNVYPSIGTARIDALALGAAFQLPIGGKIMFICVSATQWYTLNATYA